MKQVRCACCCSIPGADFNVSDSTITIEPPVITPTTHCISIAIIDDNVYEEDEYLNIMIDSVTPSVTVGTPSVVQLTIQDDDGMSQIIIKVAVRLGTIYTHMHTYTHTHQTLPYLLSSD